MSDWRQCTLGDILEIKHGYAFLGEHFTSAGTHIVLTPGNFYDEGGFKQKGDKEKWYKGPIPADYVLNEGDVIVAMTEQAEGLLGSSAIIPQSGAYLHNQRLGLVQILDEKQTDQQFIYYLFNSKTVRQQIRASASGVKIRHTAPSRIADVKVCVPPVLVQRRIAGILSAYDDLIENSQRRIQILEGMARALYREWFVQLRFPGHEKIKRVASPLGDIPQCWEVTTLDRHLAALESGKRPKGGIREEIDGVPSIGAENIDGIGRHSFTTEKRVSHDFFERMRKGVIRDRDVAIYKDGAYIGKSSYFRDGFPHSECCVNEHVFLVRGTGVRLRQNFLYLWLQEPDTVQAIRAKNANAAQPGINQRSIGGLELILPDEEIAGYFDRLVEPLLAKIINLAKRIQNLRQTRDLLLPRLLLGLVNLDAA